MSRKDRRLAQKKHKKLKSSRKVLSAEAAQQRYNEVVHLFQQGDFPTAAERADRLISSVPVSPELFQIRGLIDLNQQKFSTATDYFRKGLSADPNASSLSDLLGTALSEMGELQAATVSYRRALMVDPRNAGILNNLGLVLQKQENWEKSEKSFRDSLIYRPGDLTTLLNLADVLMAQEKFADAEEIYRNLIEADASYIDGYRLLGQCLMYARKWEEALDVAERAIGQGIIDAEIYTLKGYALGALSRFDEVEETIKKSIELEPEHTESRVALAILYFYQERWSEAWVAYEARWGLPTLIPRPFSQPRWQGEPLAGKNLLLWGEQGVGDEVLYGSMIPDLLALGPEITFETDARLVPIFARYFPEINCLPRMDEPVAELTANEFDYQISTGGLGQYLRNGSSDFGSGAAFLKADTNRTERLRKKYKKGNCLNVGLAWYSSDGRGLSKSLPLQKLAPLFDIPDVQFIDLQYGDTLDQRQKFKKDTGCDLIHDDDVDQMTNLDDFAAQISAMDLIISISNTTVHLSGALGVPTWVMLGAAPMQRWLMDRADSPWYASVELFRQRKDDDWDYVIETVKTRLEKYKA